MTLVDLPEGFAALLEAAPDAMLLVDASGAIVATNAQAEAVFVLTRAKILGSRVETLIPPRLRDRHAAHRASYAREPRVRPMGVGAELFGLRADGTEFPVEISLSPVRLGGHLFTIAAIRDVTDRKRAEAEARRQLVAKQFVRRILREFTQRGGSSTLTRRDIGRSLASETGARDVGAFLDAFVATGLGKLQQIPTAELAGRYDFSGEGLLEVTPGAGTPTCQIALGYLEGLVSQIEGGSALGAETACQSQGHPSCRFVVKAKPS